MNRKEPNYGKAKARADRLADKLGMPIDENIKELVISLWMCGIKTKMSCEGHSDRGLPYPWVSIAKRSNHRAFDAIMCSNLRDMADGENKNIWVFHPYGNGKYFKITPWDVKRPLHEMHADALKLAMFLRNEVMRFY